ncbi:MAG: hypothetical protein ABSA18_12675 [Dehalococcoidia bacterium]|jgi:hypothetical protein
MPKTELWWRLGVTLLAICEITQIINTGTSASTSPNLLTLMSYIILAAALILIAYAWLSQYIAKPIKVLDCEVHIDLITKQAPEASIIMTLTSNEDTSIYKSAVLYISKSLNKKLSPIIHLPICFDLQRNEKDIHGDYIFLKKGQATYVKNRTKIYMDEAKDADKELMLKELEEHINWELEYCLVFRSHDRLYKYRPGAKEKQRVNEMGIHFEE